MRIRSVSVLLGGTLVLAGLAGSLTGVGASPQTFYATNQTRTNPDGYVLATTEPDPSLLSLSITGGQRFFSDAQRRIYDAGVFQVVLTQSCLLGLSIGVRVSLHVTELDGSAPILIDSQQRLAEACLGGTITQEFNLFSPAAVTLDDDRLRLTIETLVQGNLLAGQARMTTPSSTPLPDVSATQTAAANLTATAAAGATATANAAATQTAIAGLPAATQTAVAQATATAGAAATATAAAAATATAGAAATATAQAAPLATATAGAAATSTIQAGAGATATAQAGAAATQTAIASLPSATQTSIAQVTATASANATATASPNATATAQAAATATAVAGLPSATQTALASASQTATARAAATQTAIAFATFAAGTSPRPSPQQYFPFTGRCDDSTESRCRAW
ncbi:MAG: hypothetical protein KatS3mg060_0603 [Dehalococcoidia bacterium]|nr:MAG: hypothetical protein KatS3mg060_0603 [Dehalococcoidia bacterium]